MKCLRERRGGSGSCCVGVSVPLARYSCIQYVCMYTVCMHVYGMYAYTSYMQQKLPHGPSDRRAGKAVPVQAGPRAEWRPALHGSIRPRRPACIVRYGATTDFIRQQGKGGGKYKLPVVFSRPRSVQRAALTFARIQDASHALGFYVQCIHLTSNLCPHIYRVCFGSSSSIRPERAASPPLHLLFGKSPPPRILSLAVHSKHQTTRDGSRQRLSLGLCHGLVSPRPSLPSRPGPR